MELGRDSMLIVIRRIGICWCYPIRRGQGIESAPRSDWVHVVSLDVSFLWQKIVVIERPRLQVAKKWVIANVHNTILNSKAGGTRFKVPHGEYRNGDKMLFNFGTVLIIMMGGLEEA